MFFAVQLHHFRDSNQENGDYINFCQEQGPLNMWSLMVYSKDNPNHSHPCDSTRDANSFNRLIVGTIVMTITLSGNPPPKWAQGLSQFDDGGARLSSLSSGCLVSLITKTLIPHFTLPCPTLSSFTWHRKLHQSSREALRRNTSQRTQSKNPVNCSRQMLQSSVKKGSEKASHAVIQMFTIGSHVKIRSCLHTYSVSHTNCCVNVHTFPLIRGYLYVKQRNRCARHLAGKHSWCTSNGW